MSLRTALIIFNFAAIAVLGAFVFYRVVSLRRNPEPKLPLNIGPGLPDDQLEGRRLERVLGWALVMLAVTVLALFVYYLVEPFRETSMEDQFKKQSIERGAVYFANEQSKFFDSTKSLKCADCHGLDGNGGSKTFVLQSDNPDCKKNANKERADCLPRQVVWQAPALTLAGLRYDRSQLQQIITYGRPGTPMPAWGVKSGRGVLNQQGIDDLVNYVESIKITPAKAKKDATNAIAKFKTDAAKSVSDAQTTISDATDALAKAQAQLAKDEANGAAAGVIEIDQREIAFEQQQIATGQKTLQASRAYAAQVAQMSEGQILFRVNCSRCHSKGYSYFSTENAATLPPIYFGLLDSTLTPGQVVQDYPDGCGAFGPNLCGGRVLSQFQGGVGVEQQISWVDVGVPANQQYGVRGISSGRMPHFHNVLTTDQIRAIVDFERTELNGSAEAAP